MNRRATALALVVLVAVGSAAVLLGVPGLGSDAPASSETPAASTGGSGGSGGGGGGAETGGGNDARTATPTPPFTFDIERLSECGRTCRDVTATVTNEQDTTAADVTVRTRIYAGRSTAKGDRIWKGTEAIGTLGPGESATSSARVKLGVFAAANVKGSDGWITVVTTVDSADRTLTFRSQRKVI